MKITFSLFLKYWFLLTCLVNWICTYIWLILILYLLLFVQLSNQPSIINTYLNICTCLCSICSKRLSCMNVDFCFWKYFYFILYVLNILWNKWNKKNPTPHLSHPPIIQHNNTMDTEFLVQMRQSNKYGSVRENEIFNLHLGSGAGPWVSIPCLLQDTSHIYWFHPPKQLTRKKQRTQKWDSTPNKSYCTVLVYVHRTRAKRGRLETQP